MVDNIHYPVQLPIFYKEIDNQLLKQISDDVIEYINSNSDKFQEVWNCPTKSTINYPLNKQIKSKTLEKELFKNVEEYHKSWGFPPCRLNLFNLWVNISSPKAYQEQHNHQSFTDKVLYSGVLYIKAPLNSGNLVFTNPLKDHLQGMLESKIHSIKLQLNPQPGLFILFPSWMEHEVLQNKSNEDRISISWNITALPPSTF